MAKQETKTLERVYTIPLRREFLKVQNWRRTEKAVKAVREFLQRHMKSNVVRIGKDINEKLWAHGIKHPPHHVKITAKRDDKGVVSAELFGVEVKKEHPTKEAPQKEAAKSAEKKEA